MTPEAQRLAIAEACGWKHIERLQSGLHGWQSPGPLEPLPDYLNDLNALHEAEKVLWRDGTAFEFANQLVEIVCSHHGFRREKCTPDDHLAFLSHATAAQRAEAFLRNLNLWTE